jgi:hypothetical protein
MTQYQVISSHRGPGGSALLGAAESPTTRQQDQVAASQLQPALEPERRCLDMHSDGVIRQRTIEW